MKKLNLHLLMLILLSLWSNRLFSQYTFFNPNGAFAIEASLTNTNLIRMPMYRNSIASLIVVGDYIIGGTKAKEGLTPFLFTASLSKQAMIDLEDINQTIEGQQSIQSGFCKGKGNQLFAGTIANNNLDNIQGDGHLIRISVNERGNISVEDLGVPVKGEGIFSLLCNAEGTVLYGISIPSGNFFSYNIENKQTKVYQEIAPTKESLKILEAGYALSPEEYLGKSLISDEKGFIYGSLPVNKLFCFDPQKETFEILETELPEVWGRRTLGRVEAWAKAKDGTLYGGNSGDGQLFALDPVSREITNLGKPIMMNRLKGLTFANNGKLYGIAGALPGYAHLFSYDADNGGFQDLGNPEFRMTAPGIEQGIQWRGFQLGSIAASEDGKYIVMGEDEALSQLLVFIADK